MFQEMTLLKPVLPRLMRFVFTVLMSIRNTMGIRDRRTRRVFIRSILIIASTPRNTASQNMLKKLGNQFLQQPDS